MFSIICRLFEFKYLSVFILAFFWFFAVQASANTKADDYFGQGFNLEKNLQIFKARDKFRAAIASAPDNSGYLTHYAWFLLSNGFHEEAASVFGRLLSMVKEKENIYSGLAWNQKMTGRLKASLESYRNVFPLKSSDENLLTAFKEIDQLLHIKTAQKIKDLKSQISKKSGDINLKKALLNAYIEQGELKNAVKTAEEIRDEDGFDMLFRLQLARVFFWNGEKLKSETEYGKLIALSPESAFLYFELAGVLDAQGRLPGAKKLLEKSLQLYPDAAFTKKRLAEVLAKSGKDKEAVKTADSIMPEDGNRLICLMAKARALHFSGHLEDARQAYKTVLCEYPNYSDALWGLSETSIFTGRYQDSQSVMKIWKKLPPDERINKQKQLFDLYTSPALDLKTEYYTNSSDFTRVNAGARYSLYTETDFSINTGYHFSEFFQDGFEDISRNSIFAGGEKYIAESFFIYGELGCNFYDNDRENLTGKLSFFFTPIEKFIAAFKYRHIDIIDTIPEFGDSIYNHVVSIGSVGLNIRSDEYLFYLLYNPAPGVSLAGEYTLGDYSDNNEKQSLMLEAGLKLSHIPYMRIAYTYFYLDYKDAAPVFFERNEAESAYYDPICFETHTLRLEYYKNYSSRLFCGAKCSASYIPKSNGFSEALFLFSSYKLKERISLRLDLRGFYQNRGVDRIGETGYFWAANYILSLRYRF